jgi:prefoldin subunit 5
LEDTVDVCESYEMPPAEHTRDELEEIITSLRDEINRLKEEIRQIRRETNEAPPHYL